MMNDRLIRSLFRLFSYGVSAVLAVCIIVFSVSTAAALTLGDIDYTAKYFTSSKVVNMLAENLDKEYEELSRKTDVPKEVYMNATGAGLISSVQRTVIKNTQTSIFVDFSGTINIENRLRESIEKYDNESGIRHTEKQVEKLISQAVDVFNQTCSIANNAQLSKIASLVNNHSLQITFISAVGIIACIFAEHFLNGGRRKSLNYVAMAMVTAGEVLAAFCVIVLLSGRLGNLSLTNIEAYNIAIASASKTVLIILFAVGILITAAGFSVFYAVYRYYRTKLMDSDTENEIAKNLIRNNENESD